MERAARKAASPKQECSSEVSLFKNRHFLPRQGDFAWRCPSEGYVRVFKESFKDVISKVKSGKVMLITGLDCTISDCRSKQTDFEFSFI